MPWLRAGRHVALLAYGEGLTRKVEVFAAETGTTKALRTALVTPGGLTHNHYASAVQSVVTSDDLFAC